MIGFDAKMLPMLLLTAAVGCGGGTIHHAGDDATTAGADTEPPTITDALPTGSLPAGTTSANLSVTTNEDATCRWDPSAETPYETMSGELDSANGRTHTASLSGLSDGVSYTYYVRCSDADGNASGATLITFSVESEGAPQIGQCPGHVAVSIDEADIDCSDSRFFCVDSTQSGGGYYSTIQAAIDAVGASAAGKVVVVYGSQTATPREYDGFAIIGNGAGSAGEASHGGSGNSASERFIVKAVGNVLLERRSSTSAEAAILVQDTDFVTIDGFDIDREGIGENTSSYSQSGMRITDTDWASTRPSYGIHVVNVSIRMGSPADLYSANVADVVIENSRLTESLPSNGYSNGGMLLYIANGPSDNTIVRCTYFADSNQMAIHSNGDDDLQEGHLYEYNIFKNVAGHGIHFQDGRDMVIRNNVFANVAKSGVTAWGINYAPESFEIYDNLLYNSAGTSPSAVQLGTDTYPADNGYHTVFNNLFIGNTQGNDITIHSTDTNVVANNFDQLAQLVDATQVSTTAVPTSVFMDHTNDDYRLASASQQTSLATLGVASITDAHGDLIVVPTLDIRSNTRGTSGITIGPYEY